MNASQQHTANLYSRKKIELAEALSLIKSNNRIVASMAAAEPQGLLGNIHNAAKSFDNVTLHCANPSRDYECFTDQSLGNRLTLNVMFLTAKVRKLQGHGRVHYVPQHLSQWVRNLTRQHPVDIFWGTASAPDERGFVSLGTGCCFESEIIRKAKLVILETNTAMPVTGGSTLIPLSWVNHIITNDHTLPSIERPDPSTEDRKIASYIAELIDHGSTLQLGIGGIPNAIGEALQNHKDLGVHTEMINDTIMDLYLKGIVTGRMKTIWPGKIVGSFIYGTKSLYEFAHDNPVVELHPSSVINDPYRIGRNHKMVSVNTAVEVDLTGQVCSESVGHSELSGVGGAFETHIGAQRSEGGRGVIALRSTTGGEKPQSKIVFELKPGAKVSVSRNDVDTIVTEFGVAQLTGKSVGERVRAMANIAHPQFRDELLSQAKKAGYL